MSKTIDERVVEMRFDNKNFESNVATSMSTLDKFKQKLKFDGAAKGLEDINSASKRVNMSGLGSSVDAVSAKFSALQVMGVTALANITNSAVNAGKKIVSALTLDPVKDGFAEYETQMNSVQTILANTQKEGTTVKVVNAALDELNTYADQTIYNFTEMTRNIGTFTAAGVKLDASVNAIKGIANLAAVSGSTSQQASNAMYQLSQALAAGKVTIMDWNSVVTANMGGQVFQDALIRTSEHLKTGAKEAINTYGTFRESLTRGQWLTTEVLTETLSQISGAYSKADLIAQGYTEDQAEEITKLAQTATDAATKVKTFSQLIDTLKEAMGSGWTKTWQLIIGDFEEAKEMWTSVSDVLSGFIQKFSDARNTLIESALGKGFASLSEKMKNLLEPAKKAVETVQTVKESISDLGSVADDVILGKFGNGKERFDLLTESGYNWCKVQNQVNEKLGNTFRYTEDQIAAQDKLLGSQKKTTEATGEASEETSKLTDVEKRRLVMLASLSDEQLRSKGYTEEQIAAFNELRDTADKLGIPLKDFIMNLDEINGRWILLDSVKNIGRALLKVFQAIGGAWREIFPAMSADNLFDIIAGFHKFTSMLILNDDQAKKLKQTLAGLFAVLDIIKTVVGGGLNIAFKVLSAVLNAFDVSLLDVTASIGDGLVAFHDWLLEGNALSQAINGFIEKLPEVIAQIKEWFDAFKETPAVQKLVTAIEAIQAAFGKLTSGEINIGEFAASLGENLAKALQSLPGIAMQIGEDFIAGFQNGISDSVTGIINNIVDFCLNFVSSFAEALGVHSPSWKAYETATDFFQGFINGASDMIGSVLSVLKTIGEKIVEVFKSFWDFITDESGNIEWGKIIASGIVVAMTWVLNKLATAFSGIANALDGVGDLLGNAAKTLKSFNKVLNGVAWDLKAQAIQKMAIAIAILVAAVWVLTTIDDPKKLRNAVGVIAVLAAVVIALAVAMSKLSDASIEFDGKAKKFNASGFQKSILQIGLTILALAAAVKLIGGMDADEAKQGFLGLAGMAGGLVVFLTIMSKVSKYAEHAGQLGSMMLKISVAMAVMVLVMKMISKMDPADIVIGIAVMEAFVILVTQMGIANRIAGAAGENFGSNVLKISVAMGIMALVMKVISGMDPNDILTGIATLQAFVLLIGEMAIINRIAGSNKSKFGSAVMGMATSIAILTGVIWLLSKMNKSAVDNGIAVMQSFVLVIAELVIVSKLAGKKAPKIAANVLAMSVAIGALAGVAILFSLIDIASLAKGIVAVGMLGLVMAAMIAATKNTTDVKGNLITMVVAIGIMTAAVVALSYIDGADLAGAVIALDSLMVCFGLMAKMATQGQNIKGLQTTLATMIGVTLILAGLVVLMAQLDPDKALPNTLALSALMIAFAASFKLLDGVKINSSVKKSLLIMSGVMVLIAVILGVMAGLNVQSSIPNALAIGVLLNLMATAFRILDGVKVNSSVKKSLLIMSGVMVILATVLGVMAALNVHASMPNALAIGTLLNLMAVAFRILDGVKINESVKKSLLIMSAVVAILAGILGIMAGLNVQASIPNALAIGTLLNLMAVAFRILDGVKINESVKKSLLVMSGAIAILAVVLGVLSLFPNASVMIPNALALGILVNAMAVAFRILDGVKINESVKSSLLNMSGCMAILALILGVLSLFPNASVMIPNAIALGILINALAAALLIASLAGNNATGAASAMIMMSVALGAVALVLGIMAAFNITPSIETALALSTLMLALSAACLICSLIPAGAGIAGALQLAAFIGIMAAVITAAGALAQIPGFTSLLADGGNVLSLVGQAIGGFVGGIIAGVAGAMISLIPELGVALSVFAVGVQPFIALVGGLDASILTSVGYLTGAILALSAASFISGITNLLSLGQSSLPKLGAELCVFGMYAKTFYDAISDVDAGAVEAATNTANMILALTVSDLLSIITEKFGGSVDFSSMGANLITFGEAVVDFSDTISGKVDTEAVEAATNAGALLVELNKSLPRSGGWIQDIIGEQDFGKFAESCKAFATCILDINTAVSQEGFEIQSDKIEQLVAAGTAFSELNSALPRTGGIAQDLAGEQDLAGFGAACVAFVACMVLINQSISSEDFVVQTDKLQQLADAGAAFNELNTNLPRSGGIAQDLAGEQDLAGFGASVAAFAACMIAVNAALSQEGFAVNLDGMEDLKQAGLKMNALQSVLPKTGGWWENVSGSSDIGDFGEKIATFATAIVDFSKSSSDLDIANINNCMAVAYRIKSFVESLKDFSTEGVDTFTGIGTGGLGADGPAYRIAKAISAFSDEVADIDTEAVTVAVSAASRLKTLINGLAKLDTSGVEKFKPGKIADQMKNYSDKITGIDTSAVSISISCANRLKSFISSLAGLDTSGIGLFKPGAIGSALNAYSSAISGCNSDSVNSSIAAATRLKNFIASLAGLDSTGVSSFKTAVNELSTVNIDEMAKAFSGASTKMLSSGADMINGLVKGMKSKLPAVKSALNSILSSAIAELRKVVPKFEDAGGAMITRMSGGMTSKRGTLTAALTSCLSNTTTIIRGYYNSFYDAGGYLVSGFAAGISANTYLATAKARAMANAANQAAKEALDINSPSKVFKKLGSYTVEGFVVGMDQMIGSVKSSSTAIANTALNGTKQAISNIAETMSTDSDYQPTIRPVLDLSDVKSGAGSIASMFNNPAIGVNGNLRAIGSMINENRQNGSSDDIITAINKLRKGLDNVGNTSYTINGITYDDGSDIHDAISAIVRKARIERRV